LLSRSTTAYRIEINAVAAGEREKPITETVTCPKVNATLAGQAGEVPDRSRA